MKNNAVKKNYKLIRNYKFSQYLSELIFKEKDLKKKLNLLDFFSKFTTYNSTGCFFYTRFLIGLFQCPIIIYIIFLCLKNLKST
jgi:hypothetical protein